MLLAKLTEIDQNSKLVRQNGTIIKILIIFFKRKHKYKYRIIIKYKGINTILRHMHTNNNTCTYIFYS